MDNQFETQTQENPQPITNNYTTYIPYGIDKENFENRKLMGRTSNAIGFSLLIALVISELFIDIITFFIDFFDLWSVKTIAILSDPATNQVINAIFSITVFTIPFILIFKMFKFRISGLIKLKKPNREDVIPYCLIGIGFCSIANIMVNYIGEFFSRFGIDYHVDYGENPQGIFGFMLTFISVAIIPPLVEEFAFRGLVLGSLRKFSDSFAIIVSAILFGLIHGNFQQIPFAFLVGLVLGYVTVKTNSIWLAVGIHAINNAVSVIVDYAFTDSLPIIQNVCYTIYLIISILLGLLGIFILAKRKNAFALKQKTLKVKKGLVYTWFLTNPTVIVFSVMCIKNACEFFQ